MPKHNIRLAGFTLLIALMPVMPVQAMVQCPSLEKMAAEFGTLANAGSGNDTPLKCSHVLEPEGPALFCYRAWPLRSADATQAFRDDVNVYAACFGKPVATEAPDVNHPDSYTALDFDVKGKRLTISLKDKGALGKTLVTKRIAPLKR